MAIVWDDDDREKGGDNKEKDSGDREVNNVNEDEDNDNGKDDYDDGSAKLKPLSLSMPLTPMLSMPI